MTVAYMPLEREWCAYVRVSKTNGREGEAFVSPSQQEAKIRVVLKTKYGVEPLHVWTDLDKTGTDDNRPEFQQAIEWVEADPMRRGIAVMDGSRLFRNAEMFMATVKRLERKGAEYLSAHLLLDAKTPEGALMRNMDAVINEFFSANIGRRWRMVQADRLEKGLPSGGPVRFGYEQIATTDEDGKIVKSRVQTPHPTHGPVLAQMYADFIAGKGAQAICKALNDEGVPSPRGKEWNIQGVLRTLDSGFGAGMIKTVEADPEGVKRAVYRRGIHEGVIDGDTWERYLRVRESRRMDAPRHKHPKWHLAKLARCGRCGASLSITSHSDTKALAICARYKSARTCEGVWMSRSKLDRAVFWWLGSRIDELARHAGEGKAREKEHGKALRALDAANDRLAALSKERIGLIRVQAASAGDLLSTDEIRAALAENEAETRTATQARDEAQREVERLAPVDDVYEAVEKWGEAHTDPAEFNVLLSRVIKKIDVTKEQVVIWPMVGQPHTVPRL